MIYIFSYIIDEEGNLLEYNPDMSTNDIDSQTIHINEDEDSNEMDVDQLEDATHLGLMSTLESDFENNLMHELDSGLLTMVGDSTSHYIMQLMDIQEPLFKLRSLLEEKLQMNLENYKFFLQGVQEVSDLSSASLFLSMKNSKTNN